MYLAPSTMRWGEGGRRETAYRQDMIEKPVDTLLIFTVQFSASVIIFALRTNCYMEEKEASNLLLRSKSCTQSHLVPPMLLHEILSP